MLKEENEIK